MVLLWCCYDVTMVLLWCCYGVAMVLLLCCYGVIMVLLWCYYDVTMVFLWCYYGVAMSAQVLYNHIVSDIRRLNAKHRNNRVNRVSLTCILLPSTALLLPLLPSSLSVPINIIPASLALSIPPNLSCYKKWSLYLLHTVMYVQLKCCFIQCLFIELASPPVDKCTVCTFKSRVSFTVYSHFVNFRFVNSCLVLVSIRDWSLLYDGGKNYVHVQCRC